MNNEDVQEVFEGREDFYEDKSKLNLSNATTTVSRQEIKELNPIARFKRLKCELDEIEKDLKFSQNNTRLNKSLNNYDTAMLELEQCKRASNFVSDSENFNFLNKLKQKVDEDPKKISILSNSIKEKINEHVIHKILIINKLKCDKPELFENVKFELRLTPDSTKVKYNSKYFDLKEKLKKLKLIIGEWDSKRNKSTISEIVKNLRNTHKLLDSDIQKDLKNKLETLNSRLNSLDEVNEEFYHNSLNRQKIDELSKKFTTSKATEQLIYSTVEKLEAMRNSHEESAFIFLKIKEMLEQQTKINSTIEENHEILSSVNENMKSNITMIKNNVELIKTKLKKLKEKSII